VSRIKSRKFILIFTAIALLMLSTIGGCFNSNSKYTIKTDLQSGLGNYLVDSNGMTLYYLALDVPNRSNATAGMLANWHVFYTNTIKVPSNLNAADFSTITRDDGTKQTEYFGWPLYRFNGDTNAGDTKGDDLNELWFVAEAGFYSVALMSNSALGTYLADGKGMTLYYNIKDSPGVSSVSGTVLANWPVFNPPAFVTPSELNTATNATKSDFTTITRSDGSRQATFKGFPLYYYIKDVTPGQSLGQGVGGIWYVVNPDNSLP
jgi:predicted lipoprotein with Yx(FWY)xxD motif